MKHILGMAKSNLDLNGVKPIKLELDFLRLVYAVKELRAKGEDAQGYLLIMTETIEQRTRVWARKYDAEDTVIVVRLELSDDQLARRRDEVTANIQAMVDVVQGRGSREGADARFGRDLGENALAALIESRETKVVRKSDQARFPFGIRWDYYGTNEVA